MEQHPAAARGTAGSVFLRYTQAAFLFLIQLVRIDLFQGCP
jgi:hypothetical protein